MKPNAILACQAMSRAVSLCIPISLAAIAAVVPLSAQSRCFTFSGRVDTITDNRLILDPSAPATVLSSVRVGDRLGGRYIYDESLAAFDPVHNRYQLNGGTITANVGPVALTAPSSGGDPTSFGLGLQLGVSKSTSNAAYQFVNVFQSPSGPASSIVFIGSLLGPPQALPSDQLAGLVPNFAAFPSRPLVVQERFYHTQDVTLEEGYFTLNGSLDSLRPCSWQIIDPSDQLQRGNAVTDEFSSLATLGREVDGTAADGVTQVALRIPSSKVGERISVNVLGYCSNATDPSTCTLSSSTQQNGGVREAGTTVGLCGDPFCDTQPITSKMTPVGPTAIALYRSPEDFITVQGDTQLVERVIFLQINSETGTIGYARMRIVRPLVVLIHGLWGDAGSWDNFSPLFQNGNSADVRFQVETLEYPDTNADHVLTNASLTLPKLTNLINTFRQTANVAATQADIVAHSMGGLISRAYVRVPAFTASRNYGTGYIHKLITVDSPHLGSPFADRLDSSGSFCKAQFANVGNSVAGAVSDLRTDSALIKTTLAQDTGKHLIRAHVVTGTASDAQAHATELSFTRLLLTGVCYSLIGFGSIRSIFGEDNDLIVGQSSQLAIGLGAAGPVPSSPQFFFIHTSDKALFPQGPDVLSRAIQNGATVGVPTAIPLTVIDLLNSPVYGAAFAPIIP